MRNDDSWRDWPGKPGLHRLQGLPDIRPLATNGVLVYGLNNSGEDYVVHFDNILQEEKQGAVRAAKPKTERAAKLPKSLDPALAAHAQAFLDSFL